MSAAVTVLGCPDELSEVLTSHGVVVDPIGPLGSPRIVVVGPALLPYGRMRAGVHRRPGDRLVAWAPGAPPSHVYELLRAGAVEVVVSDWQAVAPVVLRLLEAPSGEELEIVGRSPALVQVLRTVQDVAPTSATVLIIGETGTGKELVARALHALSGRTGRFVAIDCGALSEGLIESELFGHVKGAYTGALADKRGLFQHASGGTLFLDEVGSLPRATQSSLLRALQEKRVRPVGSCDEVPVDARIVAAASAPLELAVSAGQFRSDLRFRLDVIRLHLPPLRERSEDVPYLLARFCHEHARRHGRPEPELTPEFIAAVVEHPWSGNVRELRNFVERVVLTRGGARVDARDVAEWLARPPEGGAALPRLDAIDLTLPLSEWVSAHVGSLERRYLEEALRRSDGSMQRAAQTAGINRRTLLRKMRELGIPRPRRVALEDPRTMDDDEPSNAD